MSFLQRYIYVADILAHEIHVLEKHPNMNLTQLKVRIMDFDITYDGVCIIRSLIEAKTMI